MYKEFDLKGALEIRCAALRKKALRYDKEKKRE
jgi:hypothetical protein